METQSFPLSIIHCQLSIDFVDINLLTLSIGNSRLACGAFVSGELRQVERIPLDQPNQWPDAIRRCWAPFESADSQSIAAASVNPKFKAEIDKIAREITGQSIQWVGDKIDIPIEVKTDQPKRTGIDRVLNVAAAFEQLEHACIVVDAGTAVTVDCCDDAGAFLGGAIIPGVATMIDALASNTAGVGHIAFTPNFDAPGTSTDSAVSLGICLAIRGMVKDFAESYATRIGLWPEIIATGGDAKALFEGWELIHAISPDLGLYGIALAYTEHQIKRDEGTDTEPRNSKFE
jgi:type III pantothenate kinase